MNQHTRRPAHTVLAAVAAVASTVSLAAGAAAVDPDAHLLDDSTAGSSLGCPLTRHEDQLLRCDDLTGDGVPAPHFVPIG
ncbi:hypothetical protein MF406_01685 [Georgenia sp. TF02-10]|uniref:hypothetical protein n=1 Tax=Georgenia sp. TF02-10 TaxID=2917725 RepID=UPI001FA6FC27|nr:hypothetical protein [Georgenia sp. TF02-10]UNX55024.1 hypothetical protein MF406_01685 [Georgenia sp. TF02-10]